jgi:hypothetical protein
MKKASGGVSPLVVWLSEETGFFRRKGAKTPRIAKVNAMKAKLIAYWIVTVLFCVGMSIGGILDLLRHPDAVKALTDLGYPEYVALILGFYKVAGVIVLLLPGLRVLKEWAYAGFLFDVTGAFASHYFSKDPIMAMVYPVIFLAVGAASYLLRPESRRLAGTPSL